MIAESERAATDATYRHGYGRRRYDDATVTDQTAATTLRLASEIV